jgi:hypothetical protein
MSSHKTDRLARVLSGALQVWGVSASVEAEAQEGEFIVRAPAMTLRIVPGWLVFRDGHLLASHAGLPGLLRTLRQELAPHAAAGRLIIGARSLA